MTVGRCWVLSGIIWASRVRRMAVARKASVAVARSWSTGRPELPV